MMLDHPNYTFNGGEAELLASSIKDFWRQKGHPKVEAWVERGATDSSGRQIFRVRSNLVCGLPPRAEHAR
jgi:hypothetical protein